MVIAGNYAYVANQGSGTVSVFDTRTGALVDTNTSSPAVVDPITVGGGPTGMAASPDGNRVYVTNQGDGTLSVIDTNPTSVTYNKVISTVKVGTSPSAVAVGPDGRVYVANTGSGTVSVITFTKTSYKISTVTVGSAPAALAVSPTTGQVYVANRGINTVSVISTSNKVVKTITVGSQPSSVAITPDGKRVYVVNTGSATVSVINAATNTLVDTNPSTFFVIDPIAVGPSPTSVKISSDGATAFVANGNDTISVIDLRLTSTTYNMVITTVAIDPTGPELVGGHAIAINPTTGSVYVSDAFDGNVRVVSMVHVNTAPQIVSAPTVDSTDPTNGAVTGSVGVKDEIDGDKLTYTTASGPANGTVTYDATTGTYTYTPTEAAREEAARIGGLQDNFTVTVSDGQEGGTTTVDVTVTISPTALTNPTTIDVGQLPNAVVISGAEGNQAYVTNYYDGTVSVIDTATNEVTATISVGAAPRSLAASPDGSTVYVLNQDDSTVSVIDTSTSRVVDTIRVTVPTDESGSVSHLWDVAVGRDRTVYVSASGGTISVIDPTTHEVSGPYSVGPAATGIVVSPDGNRLYVATELWNSEMMVVDTETMQVVDTVDVGFGYGYYYPIDAEFTPDGKPDGKRLYVIAGVQGEAAQMNSNPVLIVDADPTSPTYNQVIHGIAYPDTGLYPQSVAFNPDGTRAYVSDAGGNTITVIDTSTNQVIGSITVPLTPADGSHDIAISRDGHWLYVTDQVGNAVIVVSVDSITPTTV
jgi:YVTN family beta-propeller protein